MTYSYCLAFPLCSSPCLCLLPSPWPASPSSSSAFGIASDDLSTDAIYEGILATIKYDMGSIIIPSVASHEIPVPYQLWPPLYVKLAKMSYWMLAACW